MFRWRSRRLPHEDDSPTSIDSLSDIELLDIIERIDLTRDRIDKQSGSFMADSAPVFHLKEYPDIVFKSVLNTQRNEAYIMEYIRQRTRILVPKIHRVIDDPKDKCYWMVMDYISGETLASCWSRLSWWRRLQIAFTLRSYVKQLHATIVPHADVPGPFDGTGEALPCNGFQFQFHIPGPTFYTYQDLADWHDYQHFRAQAAIHMNGVAEILQYAKFDTSEPLVLCHFDLHLANMIFDGQNRVWLIDWGYAGVYPRWFESIALAAWASHSIDPLPRSFARYQGFIVGHYPWYFRQYIYPLMTYIDSFRYSTIDGDYFEELGIDSALWHPSALARPPLRQRMVRKILDVVYNILSVPWNVFTTI
ncbi:kinase-like protein [Rickenella mellea]|uniref:Kinase-like protein n=1 Tax=Rickenella mellea TaxID=50990 RepID=A0A4Y7QKW1_9AGAM|nr:kinase-like protein [Rickenella mellea]